MKELIIKTESKPDRCEICHQTDMFNQDDELCLRCINIPFNISENNLKNIVICKDKLYLTYTDINPFYLGLFALFMTLIAHLPLMCLVTVVPPRYSGVVFFVVEIFISCFALRWKRGIFQGVLAAIAISVIIVIFLFYCNPYNVLVSHCGSRT